MTDETKKLFNAPWKRANNLSRNGSGKVRGRSQSRIVDASDRPVAYAYPTGTQKITANRLARLPELYDALANAVRDACQDCVDQVYDHPTVYDPVKQGCLFKDKNCCEMCRSWIELLRKVRDGE